MNETLQTGLTIGALGMGIVFLLLALLWGLMALLVRLDPGEPEDAPAPEAPPAPPLDPRKRAVILLAVKLHQEVRRKQAAPAMRDHPPGSLPSRWSEIGRARQSQSWHPRRRG